MWGKCKGFLYEPVFKKFLFSWDNLPETDGDKERLQKFLKDDLDIGWVQVVEITKRDKKKTIVISKDNDNDSVEIAIDEQNEKATLKISGVGTIDLKVKGTKKKEEEEEEEGKLNLYFIKFPHSKWWRVFVTIALFIAALCSVYNINNINIIEPTIKFISCNFAAICSLWVLILYLSAILWLPFHNIWECIERVKYYAVKEKEFRQKISGSLNVVSTLVAFSIAFIVVGLGITTPPEELNVFKLVMGLLVVGVIFLVVTMETYGVSLNPAFDSAQIARLYTRGWWFYTFGLYSIVIALLLYVYLLEPLITIIGVIIFIVAFTIFLRTPCDIEEKYKRVN